MALPHVRVGSSVGGGGKEVSGPEKHGWHGNLDVKGRHGSELKDAESVVFEVLEERQSRLPVHAGEWSVLDWSSSLMLRYWRHRWDHQARKQSSPPNTGPLGPHFSPHSTKYWGVCCLWGRALENRGDTFACPSAWRMPPIFSRHTGYRGTQNVL